MPVTIFGFLWLSWWRHQMNFFPRYWPFVRGIHRSPVNSPHKGQWRRALMFSLICTWINGWVNNREAGDLRPHHGNDCCHELLKKTRNCIWLNYPYFINSSPPGQNGRHFTNDIFGCIFVNEKFCILISRFKFHWSLFLRVQCTISQHWSK